MSEAVKGWGTAFIGAPSLKVVRLKAKEYAWPLHPGRMYAVIGEVEKYGRYILLDVERGELVPGTHPGHHFERFPKEGVPFPTTFSKVDA